MLVSGPSQAGKTEFTIKLVKNAAQMFTVPPKRIIWAYSMWQDSYKRLSAIPGLEMVQGVPTAEMLAQSDGPCLCVLDDLMAECSKDERLTAMFTRECHHLNLSVIHQVQNAFWSGLRTARTNASYLVLFRSPGDKLGIRTLAYQLYPSNSKFLIQSYNDACSAPYTYLLIDLTQQADDRIRLRTRIFEDEVCIVYLPKHL